MSPADICAVLSMASELASTKSCALADAASALIKADASSRKINAAMRAMQLAHKASNEAFDLWVSASLVRGLCAGLAAWAANHPAVETAVAA